MHMPLQYSNTLEPHNTGFRIQNYEKRYIPLTKRSTKLCKYKLQTTKISITALKILHQREKDVFTFQFYTVY